MYYSMKYFLFLEQSILSQYEDTLKFSEAALSSAIECIGDDPVVCPVCLK